MRGPSCRSDRFATNAIVMKGLSCPCCPVSYPRPWFDIAGFLQRTFGSCDTDWRSDSACRRRKSSIIARTLPWNCFAYSSRICRTSDKIESRAIVFPHELIWSADDGHYKTEIFAHLMNYRLVHCVGNVGAVPREQIVHSVNHTDRNMGGICQCAIRKCKTIDQRHHEIIGRRHGLEHRNSIDRFKPSSCSIRIATRSFEQHGV